MSIGALNVVLNVLEKNVVMMLTSAEIFGTGCLLTCEVVAIEGIANPLIGDQVNPKNRGVPHNGVQSGSYWCGSQFWVWATVRGQKTTARS